MFLQPESYTLPVLDHGFVPAALWNAAYERLCTPENAQELNLLLLRPDGSGSRHRCTVLKESCGIEGNQTTRRYVERMFKFLLWQRGFNRVFLDGRPDLVEYLKRLYSPQGTRSFDYGLFSERFFDAPLRFAVSPMDSWPELRQVDASTGGYLNGCRIGFDLGGSDRKCAAVIDGEVVFSEEIEWDPYHQANPEYHLAGIRDSLQRAAGKLPRIDAIGGSAAGVYMNNVPRVASLFRGIPEKEFKDVIQPFFAGLEREWNAPVRILNDGEVTALAGSMWLNRNNLLGIAMGTSLAAGYVDSGGKLRGWLNELAFCPVDYRDNAPVDEWSGDGGCGVQYFSQQAVGRLVDKSGLDLAPGLSLPETLKAIQSKLASGNPAAEAVFSTIGTYLGYALAHYSKFMELESVLLLGRVLSGSSGALLLDQARTVLSAEFPELSEKISFHQPNERLKRHGQAIAAASLPRTRTEDTK